MEDPSPSPSKNNFSPEFCSFIDACLQKDPDTRPTAEQVNKMTGVTELVEIYLGIYLWEKIRIPSEYFKFVAKDHFFISMSEVI